MTKTSINWPIILGLALLKFVLPLLFQHPMYELQRDEFLYYQQGLHPALGYLENPPIIAYLATISSWFGGSETAIKFWPCLFGAITIIITCLLTAELGGKKFAQLLAGLAILGSSYVRVHYLFQPNFLDVFFWTLAVYFLVKYINTQKPFYIYALSLALSIGWWGKYSILFMVAAIVVGLLLSPHRKVLAQKQTWLAVLAGLLIIAPNLLWQYLHNWPLFHHMEELRDTQLQYNSRLDFLESQIMMLLPVSFIWLVGLVWYFRKPTYRIVGIIYLTIVLLLLASSGKAYYALGAYPMLFAAGAVAWEHFTNKRQWIRYVIVVFIVAFNYLIMPLLLPTYEPTKLAAVHKKMGEEHQWEDLKQHDLPQDFADMLGWKEMTLKAETFYQSLPDSTKAATTILCSNYGYAGSMKFYGKDSSFTNKIVSTNGSFIFWAKPQPILKNLISVSIPAKGHPIFGHFQTMQLVDSMTNTASRQFGDKIIFYENLDAEGNVLLHKALKDLRSKFERSN